VPRFQSGDSLQSLEWTPFASRFDSVCYSIPVFAAVLRSLFACPLGAAGEWHVNRRRSPSMTLPPQNVPLSQLL